jgi:ferric-dicitrate binding protein FerR (iron transport regulator)
MINKETIIKYIEGNLSQEDIESFIMELDCNEELKKEYAKVKSEYIFDNLPYTCEGGILEEIRNDSIKVKNRPRTFFSVLTKIAAILSIPLFGYFIYKTSYSLSDVETSPTTEQTQSIVGVVENMKNTVTPMLSYSTNTGMMGKVLLPDSSVVWLNSGSKIDFPAQFDSTLRVVIFSGEGYFDIKSEKNRPMSIQTPNGISAIVKGTEFNLSCYEKDTFFKLTMINGELWVYRALTNSIIDVDNQQQVIIKKNTKGPESAKKIYADIDCVTAWKRGILKFNNTSMTEVANKLSRWYGYNVIIHGKVIESYRFTGEFHSESLIQVLDAIKLSSNVRYSIMNKDIILF